MFASNIYEKRRSRLVQMINNGIILLVGNRLQPFTSLSNTHRFRQDSTFLYYTGIDYPGMAITINAFSGETILYGDDADESEIIWTGKQTSISDFAIRSGIPFSKKISELLGELKSERNNRIHYFIPIQCEAFSFLKQIINKNIDYLKTNESIILINSIIKQRSVKEDVEINDINKTLSDVTNKMFRRAYNLIRQDVSEKEIMAEMERISLQYGNGMAFQPIISIHGEILHNPYYSNILNKGKMILIDAGAQSANCYSTDITRTYPVTKFSGVQKEIYSIVLKAQKRAIDLIEPGVLFKQIHIEAARVIVEGLTDIGIFKGDTEEIINEAVYALFFPHGLGHLLGLDVHDMENLGEDYVGYDENIKREKKFGISYLRFAKELKENHVITVEPGVYFIPELINKWKSEKFYHNFIDFNRVEKFIDFGGIRIEDDVLVTNKGSKVLSVTIPKSIEEIEK